MAHQSLGTSFGVNVLDSMTQEEWETYYKVFLERYQRSDLDMSRMEEFKSLIRELMCSIEDPKQSVAKGIEILVTVGRWTPQFVDELKQKLGDEMDSLTSTLVSES
jgi:hypothetical protein